MLLPRHGCLYGSLWSAKHSQKCHWIDAYFHGALLASFRRAVSLFITDEDMIIPAISTALWDSDILSCKHPTKNSPHLTMRTSSLVCRQYFQSIIRFLLLQFVFHLHLLTLACFLRGLGHNEAGSWLTHVYELYISRHAGDSIHRALSTLPSSWTLPSRSA